MKFVIELADKGVYTMIILPYVLIMVALILVVLIVFKWHYDQKRNELNFKRWEKLEDDNRKAEADRIAHQGNAGVGQT